MTEEAKTRRTAGLFDLRYIIATLFGVFGIVLLIMGLVDFTDAAAAKTGGININLWVGIVMIVVAALFGIWAWLRPVVIEAQVRPEDMLTPGERR
ncbi:hypothetical protein [Sciscionella marina]|uniref:hypothetical protein n=1 Tax=Sciscionella marina TaxID=508770 RepID=UPI00036D3569|nr:hypothetical protein [Sciscionella marina]